MSYFSIILWISKAMGYNSAEDGRGYPVHDFRSIPAGCRWMINESWESRTKINWIRFFASLPRQLSPATELISEFLLREPWPPDPLSPWRNDSFRVAARLNSPWLLAPVTDTVLLYSLLEYFWSSLELPITRESYIGVTKATILCAF